MSPMGFVRLADVNQLVAEHLVPYESNKLNQLGSVGMCRGMCLDWIRRFLLARLPPPTVSAAAAAAAPPSSGSAATPAATGRAAYPYALGEGARGTRRAAIMKNVHGASAAGTFMTNRSQELNRLGAQMNELGRRLEPYQGNKILTDAEQAEWRRLGDQRSALAEVFYPGLEEHEALTARIPSQGGLHPAWGLMRRDLDGAAERARTPGHHSRRPFSALTSLDGTVIDRTVEGTKQVCGRAVAGAHNHSKTHGGAAAAILCASTGAADIAGHAVAIVAAAPDFYLFDPNFGVFTPREGNVMKLILGIAAILDAYYEDCPRIEIAWLAAGGAVSAAAPGKGAP